MNEPATLTRSPATTSASGTKMARSMLRFGIFHQQRKHQNAPDGLFGPIAYGHAQIIIRTSPANALSEPATIDQQRIKKKP
ncbi:MAG: hypothetical protein IPL59_15195 [Candidatus Competibacteraceae bacterium]|nr:hypothetical protein [Candidatus Competibacteraceae bacterium]